MTVSASQCVLCRHYRLGQVDPTSGLDTCEAFPNGIRLRIMDNIPDHRRPITGDRGIRWEPAEPGIRHPLD